MPATLARPAAGSRPSPVPTLQRHYWSPACPTGRFCFTVLPAGGVAARVMADARSFTLALDTDGDLEALYAAYRAGGCPAAVLADALDDRRPPAAGRDWDAALAVLRS